MASEPYHRLLIWMGTLKGSQTLGPARSGGRSPPPRYRWRSRNRASRVLGLARSDARFAARNLVSLVVSSAGVGRDLGQAGREIEGRQEAGRIGAVGAGDVVGGPVIG